MTLEDFHNDKKYNKPNHQRPFTYVKQFYEIKKSKNSIRFPAIKQRTRIPENKQIQEIQAIQAIIISQDSP